MRIWGAPRARAEIERFGDVVQGFLHHIKDLLMIGLWRLLQDSGERGAGVFHVGVDAGGQQRLMTDIAAREIKAAINGQARLGGEVLREQLAEDELLGEVF